MTVPEGDDAMTILKREHWLVKMNYAITTTIFLFTFAALQRTELVQEYALLIWSFEFLSFTLVSGVVAFVAAGIAMNFGHIVMSTLYCVMTHDTEMHWFPRMVVSAKTLIDRPRWAAESGF